MMLAGLAGLFGAAFVAATPFPFNSEVVFVPMVLSEAVSVTVLIAVATIGNVLGSCLTYGIGRGLGGMRGSRWMGRHEDGLRKAEGWFQKWGLWSLLLSWAPGGDLIVAISGLLRVPVGQFLALVTLAKAARYIVLAVAVTQGAKVIGLG